jgi:hypothetical protein
MFSVDHTSGYVHVRLTPESETFFGFEWQGVYYVYCTLSFGWQASPFIYNTLSGAVAQFLRRHGIRNLFYLDDSLYLPLFGHSFRPRQTIMSSSSLADATVYIVCCVLV